MEAAEATASSTIYLTPVEAWRVLTQVMEDLTTSRDQKNTNLKLGDSYLVWFNESNDSYKIYKCHDYQNEVKLMIDHFKSMKV